MTRNWGMPPKSSAAFGDARERRPVLTLAATAAFGFGAAMLAAASFGAARTALTGLFHGPSLLMAIVAAGFGCWAYLTLSWSRFAAQFAGGDAFSDLIRFYAKALVALFVLAVSSTGIWRALGGAPGGVLLCVAGGAAAAAAFQTVMMFVPASRAD